MREFPPEGEVNKPFDHFPIIWLAAAAWTCPRCDPDSSHGSLTTIDWVGTDSGNLGRCGACGQKYMLARPFERVPKPEEQRGWVE